MDKASKNFTHTSFARILVEIDLLKALPSEVVCRLMIGHGLKWWIMKVFHFTTDIVLL